MAVFFNRFLMYFQFFVCIHKIVIIAWLVRFRYRFNIYKWEMKQFIDLLNRFAESKQTVDPSLFIICIWIVYKYHWNSMIWNSLGYLNRAVIKQKAFSWQQFTFEWLLAVVWCGKFYFWRDIRYWVKKSKNIESHNFFNYSLFLILFFDFIIISEE